MPAAVLVRICLRSGRKRPLRTLLMVLGIAMGVAGVIAIDMAKSSVSKSFELSTKTLTARSTHQIVGPKFEIPQSLFTHIRTNLGIFRSAPVIETHIKLPGLPNRVFTFLGVDPFSERHFRELPMETEGNNLSGLLTFGSGVLMAKTGGIRVGDTLDLAVGKRIKKVMVKGFLDSPDPARAAALSGIILADISLAQELLEMGDRITRMDLVIEDKAQLQQVQASLPKGVFLVETQRRTRSVRSMSKAFETSLTAFSMLALFMGIFLIYNTVSFSVARQRPLNGTLRALGATRRQIFFTVLAEVSVYALAGSFLGVLLGILMGKGAVQAVCATVSDMYFTLTVNRAHITVPTLAKGIIAGLVASFLAAFFPALHAARTRPVTLLQSSKPESAMKKALPRLFGAGILVLLAAFLIFNRAPDHPGLDFIGIFLLFSGASLCVPLWIRIGIKGILAMGRTRFSVLFRMALGNIIRSLSRTGVLMASLMVVVSVYMGIEVMTASFRLSIIDWVDGHIGGHVHVANADRIDPALDPALIGKIRALPQVADLSAYNIHPVYSKASGRVHLFSYASDKALKRWAWTAADEADLDGLLQQGWVFVSEIFARQNHITPGPFAQAILETLHGPKAFPVAGIFRDFFMGGGRVILSPKHMKQYFGYDDITALQLFLRPGASVDRTMAAIRSFLPPDSLVEIRSGRRIKQDILAVFDKTFLITSALQLLTAIVALTGILNAVMALLGERRQEIGLLRACGAQALWVKQLLLLECLGFGMISGILALPLGWVLSWVLVEIVNQRSFGWTYDLVVSPAILVRTVLLSSLAALLAGILPGIRAGRTDIATALHTE